MSAPPRPPEPAGTPGPDGPGGPRRVDDPALLERAFPPVEDPESSFLMLNAYRQGDREAGERLLQRYERPLAQYVRIQLRARDGAGVDERDVVQDALTELVPRLADFEYRGKGSVLAWLRTVARNRLRDLARRAGAKREEPLPEPGVRADPVAEGEPDPREVAERRELEQIVEQAMAELPEKDREVLLLHKVLGGGWQQIADQLGLESAHAAQMRYQRAKERWYKLALPRLKAWRT